MTVSSSYFSGQGRVLVASRDSSGNNTGFREVGNVSALTTSMNTSTTTHKENMSGARTTDLILVTEISAEASVTFESVDGDNLALALWGTTSSVASETSVSETITAYLDLVLPLSHLSISDVSVTDSTGETTYTVGTDYEIVSADAGSIRVLSSGSISSGDSIIVTYTHAAYTNVNAVTQTSAPEVWLRFEGLNTVDSTPVVVNAYKCSAQPLQELALISDEVAGMQVTMTILRDSLRDDGDQFFGILKA